MDYNNKYNRINQSIAKATAKRLCVKSGKVLHPEEMSSIATALSKCKVSDIDTDGNPTYVIMNMDAVDKMFYIK